MADAQPVIENRSLLIAGVAGVLFILSFVAGFIVAPQGPDYHASTGTIVSFYSHHRTGVLVGTWLTGLYAILYSIFLAGLWGLLRRGPVAWIATMALVVGFLDNPILLIGHAVNNVLTDHTARYASDPVLLTALFKLASLLTSLFTMWTDGLSLVAFSVALLLAGTVPRWVTWISWIGVLAGLVLWIGSFGTFDPTGPVAGIAMIAFLAWFVWIIGLSIYLVRGGGTAVRAEASARLVPTC